MRPAEAGTLHPGGGGVGWVKAGRRRVSYNRTWTSIGHVARVSPAPLSRDNQAACSGVGRHGDRSAPREVTRANSCGPAGWGSGVSLAGAGWGSQGPLEVSCGAAPGAPMGLPPSLLPSHPSPTIPGQLLFPDFAPEFIKLPGLSYTLPHLICLSHVGVIIPCVSARFPESSENIRCCFSSFNHQSTLLEPLHYAPFYTQAPF